MTFDFLFTDEQRADVRSEYGENVVEALVERMEKKKQQLEHVDDISQLRPRFHRMIGRRFPEMRFHARNRQWRAVFIAVETDIIQKLVFNCVIRKNSSWESQRQGHLLRHLQDDPGRAVERAKDLILEQDAF